MPTHRGAFQVDYTEPRLITVVLDLQASGAQFDDDLNTPSRVLPKCALVANVSLSRRVAGTRWKSSPPCRTYIEQASSTVVASLPAVDIGAPRMISAGVRIEICRGGARTDAKTGFRKRPKSLM